MYIVQFGQEVELDPSAAGVWFWRRDKQTSRHPCLRDLTVGDIRAHWAIQVTHDAKHHHIDFSDDPLYSSSASTLRRPFQMLVHLCASHRCSRFCAATTTKFHGTRLHSRVQLVPTRFQKPPSPRASLGSPTVLRPSLYSSAPAWTATHTSRR
ncbi:MAG: hypothetical protein MHM6MM_007949 [Cercozoa sp. M6MM]